MSTDQDCSCGDCTSADLPVTPFEALRARHGMLLGEDDFRALMGNPRGKQMLHSAWLHGKGVVWGYDVRPDGLHKLAVRPGLAVDGWGRELLLASSATVDLTDWLAEHDRPETQDGCRDRTVTACLVAEFDCSSARPVPTLADPCDVTRTHDTASRILEEVRIALVPGNCPPCHRCRRYHRLRVLLGLDDPEDREDRAGREAAAARADVAGRPPQERVRPLCHHLHCLGVRDAAEQEPACLEGTDIPGLFPVDEKDAGVVLSCVEIDVRDAAGCTTIQEVRLDDCCRCLLLPTQVITELLCAVAARTLDRHRPEPPGGYGHGHDYDDRDEADEPVEGPRVHGDDVRWDEDEGCYLVPVSGELVAGSVRRAVTVTSLSARGWVEEDVEAVRYDADGRRIVVRMAARPQNSVVRLLVKGTGPTPVYGVEPAAPLAGVLGGPRGGRHDGHDAVVTVLDGPGRQEGS